MAEQEQLFLKFLVQASVRQAKLLLQSSTPNQLIAIAEVCLNLLHGDIDSELKKDLKAFKGVIRKLSDKRTSAAERKQVAIRKASAVQKILRLAESLLP